MNPFLRVLLVVIGLVLLLPGLCSAAFFALFVADGESFFTDGGLLTWAMFGVPGFAIATGGWFLIRRALRT